MVLETIRMAPERPRTVLKGPRSAPEVSGMSRNGPGMSRKVLEASRRSWKVPGITTHSPAPLALGGKPPRLPWPAKGWGRTKGKESPSRWDFQNPLWQVSGGKVWGGLEGLGVQVGLPNLLELRPRPLGHLYKVSQGWGKTQTTCPQGLCATLPPLNPVAPLLDPGLDAVLDRNPLGFSPSSFLGGVHLWTAERCWISATGCVDTNGGVVPLTLLRGACSWDLSVGLDRGTCSWD